MFNKNNYSMLTKSILLTSILFSIVLFAQNSNSSLNKISSNQDQLFSVESGFFSDNIDLEFNTNDGEEILYTIDGSEPTLNSFKYQGTPISINRTTVIRARTFINDTLSDNTETNTYFINEHSDLPIFSLSTTPSNFWDSDSGIYVKGNNYDPEVSEFSANYWQDWERPVHIEFFDQDGSIAFKQNAGMKIFGSWSRTNSQKSLTIHARKIYGKKKFDYPLIPSLDIKKYKSFVLRNSGTDWTSSMFRDGFIQSLLENEDLDKIAFRPAIVFLNGEYWGIHNIREKINDNYIGAHHNVDKDAIDLLEGDAEIIRGSNDSYISLINYIENNDISDPDNYQTVVNQIDIDNFITYQTFEIFIANTDWPSNNIKYWRPQTENGRWRWILHDTDFGFNLTSQEGYKHNSLDFALTNDAEINYPNPPWATFLLRKLLENESFKNKFISKFADFSNTIFNPDFIKNRIEDFKGNINSEIERHLERWYNGNFSRSNWESVVEEMKIFADERLSYLKPFYVERFGLGESQFISLDVSDKEAGKIQVNTIKVKSYPWEGEYFSNIPVKLTAISNPGYRFVEWVGDYSSLEAKIEISLNATTVVQAIFEKTDDVEPIVINEINYDSHKNFDTEDWIELYNNSEFDVNLSNWIFSDGKDTNQFVIPESTILEANGYLVLCRSTADFDSLFNQVGNLDIGNFIGDFDFKLSNKGELIRLFNSDGNIVDSVRYDNKLPWPEEAAGNGPTLELKDPSLDNYNSENWGNSSTFGTPGTENDSYIVSVENRSISIPTEIKLYQNYPNPFNPTTTIKYSIPLVNSESFANVSLKIFDILGKEIKTLVNQQMTAGEYSVDFDAKNLSSGVYYYQIKVNSTGKESFMQTKKMTILK